MFSLKLVVEFCNIKCKFFSIQVDLLQSLSLHHCLHHRLKNLMADSLHKGFRSMTIEDDDPIKLPDESKYRVFDANRNSLMERLLNSDCQVMGTMINYMPTAWRVYNRVRGIALSRDTFQFIFQLEEDLLTDLKERPWSYNHWTMLLERWTPSLHRISCALFSSGSEYVTFWSTTTRLIPCML